MPKKIYKTSQFENFYVRYKAEGLPKNITVKAFCIKNGVHWNRKPFTFRYLSIGVIWLDKKISSNFAVVNQHTESYDIKYTA